MNMSDEADVLNPFTFAAVTYTAIPLMLMDLFWLFFRRIFRVLFSTVTDIRGNMSSGAFTVTSGFPDDLGVKYTSIALLTSILVKSPVDTCLLASRDEPVACADEHDPRQDIDAMSERIPIKKVLFISCMIFVVCSYMDKTFRRLKCDIFSIAFYFTSTYMMVFLSFQLNIGL